MLVNIHVPGYPTGLPIHINETMSLIMYSWADIISGNIVSNPDKMVKIQYMEYNGTKLDMSKSLQELEIPESAVLSIYCKISSITDLESISNNENTREKLYNDGESENNIESENHEEPAPENYIIPFASE